jgi:hypothetical protein
MFIVPLFVSSDAWCVVRDDAAAYELACSALIHASRITVQ